VNANINVNGAAGIADQLNNQLVPQIMAAIGQAKDAANQAMARLALQQRMNR
jgi:hypothetical protein